MPVDVLSTLLRAGSFIAMFQAGGIAIFLAMFGRRITHASQRVRLTGFVSAIAGLLLVSAQYLLEAARMAGAMTGLFDRELQQLVFDSPMRMAATGRLLGLVLIAVTVRREGRVATLVSLLGMCFIVAGFTFVGHTADHGRLTVMSVPLSLHLLVVSFWFGSLAPLYFVSRLEQPPRTAGLVASYSRIAGVVVPGLFLMGAVLSVMLLKGWVAFGEPYGRLLAAKIAGFALLMGLASLNKWRFGPALAESPAAVAAFQRTLVAEFLLISAVLAITAVMTTFYSPSD